jgi:hypothetical protein
VAKAEGKVSKKKKWNKDDNKLQPRETRLFSFLVSILFPSYHSFDVI